MTPLEGYREYLALKNHFTKASYNYFKYNGKVKVNPETFKKRRDYYFFTKLIKHKDPKHLIIANLVDNPSKWIGEIVNEGEDVYKAWAKRTQSFTYVFKEELGQMYEDFNKNFKLEHGHPKVLQLYIEKKISLETLIVLVDLVRCYSYFDKNMKGDILWEEISFKMQKYKPFLEYERTKYKQILLDKFKPVE